MQRLVRNTSGTVVGRNELKCFSEYNRKHLPGPSRPARPARCVADARDVSSTRSISMRLSAKKVLQSSNTSTLSIFNKRKSTPCENVINHVVYCQHMKIMAMKRLSYTTTELDFTPVLPRRDSMHPTSPFSHFPFSISFTTENTPCATTILLGVVLISWEVDMS